MKAEEVDGQLSSSKRIGFSKIILVDKNIFDKV